MASRGRKRKFPETGPWDNSDTDSDVQLDNLLTGNKFQYYDQGQEGDVENPDVQRGVQDEPNPRENGEDLEEAADDINLDVEGRPDHGDDLEEGAEDINLDRDEVRGGAPDLHHSNLEEDNNSEHSDDYLGEHSTDLHDVVNNLQEGDVEEYFNHLEGVDREGVNDDLEEHDVDVDDAVAMDVEDVNPVAGHDVHVAGHGDPDQDQAPNIVEEEVPPEDTDDDDIEIFEEVDDYSNLLQHLSREWLKVELKHRVSKVASNSLWDIARAWFYRLFKAKEMQKIKRKPPTFDHIRRQMHKESVPPINMEFGFQSRETKDINIIRDTKTPRTRFPPHEFDKVWEIANVQVNFFRFFFLEYVLLLLF